MPGWVGVTSYPACRIVNNTAATTEYTSTMSTRVSVPGPALQHGIGVIAPFDLALDRELRRWTPADVSLYVTRTPFVAEPVSIELAEAISYAGLSSGLSCPHSSASMTVRSIVPQA